MNTEMFSYSNGRLESAGYLRGCLCVIQVLIEVPVLALAGTDEIFFAVQLHWDCRQPSQ
jgi:hypothetical protein